MQEKIMEIFRIICVLPRFDIEVRTRASMVAGSGGFGSGRVDCDFGKSGVIVVVVVVMVVVGMLVLVVVVLLAKIVANYLAIE